MHPSQKLFPHAEVRAVQSEFIKDVHEALSSKKCMIAHAPTGLGKTAAALAPAISFAIDNKLTVLFLTARHTQHRIAIDTLKQIKKKYALNFVVTDIVGKKNMCAQESVDVLPSKQFHDYCRYLRETGGCSFYSNFKLEDEISPIGIITAGAIKSLTLHTEESVALAKQNKVCPYEAAIAASKEASVIVADYYYLFNPRIRERFLFKISRRLEECIIIVDEAHNLPSRLREMLSERLTTASVERAIKEAERFTDGPEKKFLTDLRNALLNLSPDEGEKLVSKDDLYQLLKGYDISEMLGLLDELSDSVREIQKQTFIGGVADFLRAWSGSDEGYARLVSNKEIIGNRITLSYVCLDPALKTRSVMENAHSVILMSGTLTPTSMYKNILGIPKDAVEREYRNPFPRQNKLSLIVPSATTKYSRRNDFEYQRLGDICVNSINQIPGNTAVFFSSYEMMNDIYKHIYGKIAKNIFKEHPMTTKQEKHELLEGFKASSKDGGSLFAVIGGSFNEGIDLPGDLLKGVIIVGLPLQKPDLEVMQLISYYDKKFGKGWDYGYVLPAFTKALQSAGRCIRSETDKGIVLFVDERYSLPRYRACFPKDSNLISTSSYAEQIRQFFS